MRKPVLLTGLAAAGLAIFVIVSTGPPGGSTADAIADDYGARGCSSISREAPGVSEVQVAQRSAAGQAEESLVLRCIASMPGPEVVLYRFESSQAAALAAQRLDQADVSFCRLETEIVAPGPVAIVGDARQACELLRGRWRD